MSFSAVIVAAGSGLRAGPGAPKAWRELGGRPILRWSADAFAAAGATRIVLVVASDRVADGAKVLAGVPNAVCVTGGATRFASVQLGLDAISGGATEPVLIHDAARPFLEPRHVERLLAALATSDAAILALPVADTLKRGGERIAGTVDRQGLWRAQTPQAFRLGALREAYAAWPAGEEPTDDAAVAERNGQSVALVPGDPRLMKLTYPEDFQMAEQLTAQRWRTRFGQGVDAHRFGPGSSVWLCGVEIPHDRGLVGHSDADAGLHALTDALLGALGDGDIGEHFPPSDPQWRGASSDRFLTFAVDRVAARGGRLVNADVTLVCERPKIRPHRDAMRARLAALLGLPIDAVSVKATTTEGMGFTGREEGLLAQAVVALELPDGR